MMTDSTPFPNNSEEIPLLESKKINLPPLEELRGSRLDVESLITKIESHDELLKAAEEELKAAKAKQLAEKKEAARKKALAKAEAAVRAEADKLKANAIKRIEQDIDEWAEKEKQRVFSERQWHLYAPTTTVRNRYHYNLQTQAHAYIKELAAAWGYSQGQVIEILCAYHEANNTTGKNPSKGKRKISTLPDPRKLPRVRIM